MHAYIFMQVDKMYYKLTKNTFINYKHLYIGMDTHSIVFKSIKSIIIKVLTHRKASEQNETPKCNG